MVQSIPTVLVYYGGKRLISSGAQYAVRAMLDMADNAGGTIVTTRQISERQGLPRVFLTKIVERLVHAGLLRSHRGAKGGLVLAKSAHEINLREIIEAIDGPLHNTPCVIRTDDYLCDDRCPIYTAWTTALNKFVELLESHTLASLVCSQIPVYCKFGKVVGTPAYSRIIDGPGVI